MTKKVSKQKEQAFVILKGADNIQKAIKSIQVRGKALEKVLHQAAVSCLAHAGEHGDVTLAQKLVEAVPTLARKNALRDWFIAFGRFQYHDEKKTIVYAKGKETLLDEAIKMPFWEFKPEAEYIPFDFDKAITALLKRASQAKDKGDSVDEAKLNKLKDLITVMPDI